MAENEYIPFGPEWKEELMKISKPDLIDMHAATCKDAKRLGNRVTKLESLVHSPIAFAEWISKQPKLGFWCMDPEVQAAVYEQFLSEV